METLRGPVLSRTRGAGADDEITHVVFTLSQWGSLRLQIQQLPHEYLFVREYLPLVLQKRDIHLIGEFVECLRIFGVA